MKRRRTIETDSRAHRRAVLHHAAHVEAAKLGGVRRKKAQQASMRPITLPRVRFLERPEPEDADV